jgi:hypothetical protein
MKKLLLVLLFTLAAGSIWLLSCSKTSPEDTCGSFDNRFSSTGIILNTLKTVSYDSAASRYYFDTVKNPDTVQFDELAIRLIPEKRLYIGSAIPGRSSSSMFSEAYACTPPIPYSDERIDYITITTTTDFDQGHPAGSNLSDLFDVAILDKYRNINYTRMSLAGFMALRPNTKDELILFLNKAPGRGNDFVFQVRYCRTLVSDQEIFTAGTVRVYIPGE